MVERLSSLDDDWSPGDPSEEEVIDYERSILQSLEEEPSAVVAWCKVGGLRLVVFTSYSGGRGRRRKMPQTVMLITHGARTWSLGETNPDRCVPLDKIAQEVLPEPVYDRLGSNPGRQMLEELLAAND